MDCEGTPQRELKKVRLPWTLPSPSKYRVLHILEQNDYEVLNNEGGQGTGIFPLCILLFFLHISETVGGPAWQYFSAVCWYYGVQLYEELKYPIGLVATTWGGTPVEAWSSPDALATCGINTTKQIVDNRKYVEKKDEFFLGKFWGPKFPFEI